MAVPVLGQSGRSLVNRGNDLYEEEKYDEALSNYKAALGKKAPQDIVKYNLGNVYYRKDSYDLAEQELEAAIQSEDPELQARGYFNRGNSRFKQQQFDRAIQDYIEVLKRHPDDMGAKVNLELARRMMQLQQQQQQQQTSQDSTQQDREQQQQQEQEQQPEEQQQEQQEREQSQQEQEEQQEQQRQQQAEMREEELSQEEAEKLLNALQSDEKAVLQELLRRQMPEAQRGGKDW
jgi:Ca-activated chloride channel family protein